MTSAVSLSTIVLTFDNLGEATELQRGEWDGGAPLGRHPSVTVVLPRLLDELDHHRLRATFCVEAINCALNPDAVREIAARGHELAAHGWSHEPWSELHPAHETELLRRGAAAYAALGVAVTGFRPPGGGLPAGSAERLAAHGISWCSPEAGAVPSDPGDVAATRPPRWAPFRWELVDAYLRMESFASLRMTRGDPRRPLGAAAAGERLRTELLSAAGPPPEPRVLVMHPFLMLDEAWWEQTQGLLAAVAARVADGDTRCLTAAEAAGPG